MGKLKGLIFIFCLLLIFFASPSFSQSPGMRFRPWGGELQCKRASELNLSIEQTKGLDLIQQNYFREVKLLRSEIFSKTLELREFLIDPIAKIEPIRSKHAEINDLQIRLERKSIEYLIRVRNLLTQEQLRSWCPEQEFPLFGRRMHEPYRMGPMPPGKPPFHSGPKEE
jgi:hypothetical protein